MLRDRVAYGGEIREAKDCSLQHAGNLQINGSKNDCQNTDGPEDRLDGAAFVTLGIEDVALGVVTSRGGVRGGAIAGRSSSRHNTVVSVGSIAPDVGGGIRGSGTDKSGSVWLDQ